MKRREQVNEPDDAWHRFPRLAGHDGVATYEALMGDSALTYPCDFALLMDADGESAARNEWVCSGDVQLSSDAQRSRGVIEHPASSSGSLPCSSPEAMALLGPKVRDAEVAVLTCEAHTGWLYEHSFVDGVYDGVMARRERGLWVTTFARTWR